MRYFVVLALSSCLLALCHAAREVSFKDEKMREETYYSDDYKCHRVGRKYHEGNIMVAVVGGPVMLYSDSKCKEKVFLYQDPTTEYQDLSPGIKSYRAYKPSS
ncbi:hypothetical protein H4218_000033 [Coemansia sp. IMI 209128]|nr:hypothetical protein H4218_000033 [Coemansia sp. IMI 209128]